MLDIKFIRENREIVEQGIKNKNVSVDLNGLLLSDENTSLYEILSYRIFQSAKVIVDDIDSSTL